MVSLQNFFSEVSPLWPGQILSLKLEKELYHQRSAYQDIKVIKSETYGNVLILDGIIQYTEKDEFAYHEMMAHIPLFCHPAPKKVLIIGGGDGGVVREVTKHPEVTEIHLCEIDEKVIEVVKTFFPNSMAVAFDSPKLTVHIGDGIKFLEENKGEFDIIIVDCTDPVDSNGPAEALFEEPFYQSVYSSLKDDGIICGQEDGFWLNIDTVSDAIVTVMSAFPVVDFSFASVPSFPFGQIGFFLASKNKNWCFRKPLRDITEEQLEEWKLKYYNSEVHAASFVHPQFVKKLVHDTITMCNDSS